MREIVFIGLLADCSSNCSLVCSFGKCQLPFCLLSGEECVGFPQLPVCLLSGEECVGFPLNTLTVKSDMYDNSCDCFVVV